MHGLAGNENVEFVWIEDQFVATAAVERFPEIENVVGSLAVDVDDRGVMLAAIPHQAVRAGALEVDGKCNAAAGDVWCFAGHQRFCVVQVKEFGLAEKA